MSFVPEYFKFLVEHLQKNRCEVIKSLAVVTAPEHWLSLEASALLDINRGEFKLDKQLDGDGYIPRWLIAAERKKVDLWVEDCEDTSVTNAIAIEFKVVHNNKNIYQKVKEIRRDLQKKITGIEGKSNIERWGIVLLVYSRFIPGQEGNYSYLSKKGVPLEYKEFYKVYSEALIDNSERSKGAKPVHNECEPQVICSLDGAPYIEDDKGSQILMALVKNN